VFNYFWRLVAGVKSFALGSHALVKISFEVMKTLEAGVEILQKEKDELLFSKSLVVEKVEAQKRNIETLDEQISSLHDRNATLSKKCVDLLEVGKDGKERFFI
jgi:formylmethanofuran dehydrogenase subunit B